MIKIVSMYGIRLFFPVGFFVNFVLSIIESMFWNVYVAMQN